MILLTIPSSSLCSCNPPPAGSPWDRAILTRHVRPMFVVTTQKDETDNDETYTYPIRTEPLSSSQTRYIARRVVRGVLRVPGPSNFNRVYLSLA
jgi:hypothetical protein